MPLVVFVVLLLVVMVASGEDALLDDMVLVVSVSQPLVTSERRPASMALVVGLLRGKRSFDN
jgi:hypothetical protein